VPGRPTFFAANAGEIAPLPDRFLRRPFASYDGLDVAADLIDVDDAVFRLHQPYARPAYR